MDIFIQKRTAEGSEKLAVFQMRNDDIDIDNRRVITY